MVEFENALRVKFNLTKKPIETAIRELNEEAGLSPINKWTVDQVNHFYETEFSRMNLIPIFGVEVDSLRAKLSDEHCDYQWCELEDAINYLRGPNKKMLF